MRCVSRYSEDVMREEGSIMEVRERVARLPLRRGLRWSVS